MYEIRRKGQDLPAQQVREGGENRMNGGNVSADRYAGSTPSAENVNPAEKKY